MGVKMKVSVCDKHDDCTIEYQKLKCPLCELEYRFKKITTGLIDKIGEISNAIDNINYDIKEISDSADHLLK